MSILFRKYANQQLVLSTDLDQDNDAARQVAATALMIALGATAARPSLSPVVITPDATDLGFTIGGVGQFLFFNSRIVDTCPAVVSSVPVNPSGQTRFDLISVAYAQDADQTNLLTPRSYENEALVVSTVEIFAVDEGVTYAYSIGANQATGSVTLGNAGGTFQAGDHIVITIGAQTETYACVSGDTTLATCVSDLNSFINSAFLGVVSTNVVGDTINLSQLALGAAGNVGLSITTTSVHGTVAESEVGGVGMFSGGVGSAGTLPPTPHGFAPFAQIEVQPNASSIQLNEITYLMDTMGELLNATLGMIVNSVSGPPLSGVPQSPVFGPITMTGSSIVIAPSSGIGPNELVLLNTGIVSINGQTGPNAFFTAPQGPGIGIDLSLTGIFQFTLGGTFLALDKIFITINNVTSVYVVTALDAADATWNTLSSDLSAFITATYPAVPSYNVPVTVTTNSVAGTIVTSGGSFVSTGTLTITITNTGVISLNAQVGNLVYTFASPGLVFDPLVDTLTNTGVLSFGFAPQVSDSGVVTLQGDVAGTVTIVRESPGVYQLSASPPTGPRGPNGSTGPTGPAGNQGPPGASGLFGIGSHLASIVQIPAGAPGGGVQGGTCNTSLPALAQGSWNVRAVANTALTAPGGTATLTLYKNGQPITQKTSTGAGGGYTWNIVLCAQAVGGDVLSVDFTPNPGISATAQNVNYLTLEAVQWA